MRVAPARLVNPIRPYAWGSKQAIAQLQGRPTPTPRPEAELWVGAHGTSPSIALLEGRQVPLDELIAADPEGWLGGDLVARFGPQLPFLMKVLAAERPLSLQAHPDEARARLGFEAEEARSIPLDAPERNYRDPWPKPELLRALTPFVALCGFRDVKETRELLAALAVPRLGWVVEELRDGPEALHEVVRRLLVSPEHERRGVVGAFAEACARHAAIDGAWAEEARWGHRLAERYPADPGVVVALLLELVRLEPGEAVHLPPGRLHAYLHGVGVEVMASSDNVLRGGLTEKHVDHDELLEVIGGTGASPVRRVAPVGDGPELLYAVPEPHFRLSELRLAPGRATRLEPRGVQLLLATDGIATATAGDVTLELCSGEGAIVPAAAGAMTLLGAGTVFRVTVGDPPAPHAPSGRPVQPR